MRRLLLRDAGQDLGLGAQEGVPDEGRERARRDRQVEVELRFPLLRDAGQQVPPARDRISPVPRQLLVREPDGPQLPEDAHVARAEVLAQVGAGGAPLFGQGLRSREQSSLTLEEALVLPLENLGEQVLLAAEVVVDERELHVGAIGDRARRGACVAVFRKRVAGGIQDQDPCVLPSRSAQIDLLGRT